MLRIMALDKQQYKQLQSIDKELDKIISAQLDKPDVSLSDSLLEKDDQLHLQILQFSDRENITYVDVADNEQDALTEIEVILKLEGLKHPDYSRSDSFMVLPDRVASIGGDYISTVHRLGIDKVVQKTVARSGYDKETVKTALEKHLRILEQAIENKQGLMSLVV